MHLTEFFIGGNVKGKPTFDHDSLVEKTASILQSYGIDSFSCYPIIGYWQGEKELSIHVKVFDSDIYDIEAIKANLEAELQQQEVLTLFNGEVV